MVKVSVIIPVFNMAHYLRQCLESVKNQTLKDIEIICVNDCSTDNSLEILNEYKNLDDRFVVIDLKENIGLGYVRNLALSKANGNYIMFLDSDDWLKEDACEYAYNKIVENDDDIVFFNLVFYDELKQSYVDYNGRYAKSLQQLHKSTNINKVDIPYCGWCWCKIYKKDFLQNNDCKFSETRDGEDRPFAVMTTLRAAKISYLDKVLYCYRINQQNKKRKALLSKRTLNGYIDSIEICIDLLLQNNKATFYHNCTMLFFIGETIKSLQKYSKNRREIYQKVRNILLKIKEYQNFKNICESLDANKFSEFEQIIRFKSYEYYLLNKILKNLFVFKKTDDKIAIRFFGISIAHKWKK